MLSKIECVVTVPRCGDGPFCVRVCVCACVCARAMFLAFHFAGMFLMLSHYSRRWKVEKNINIGETTVI